MEKERIIYKKTSVVKIALVSTFVAVLVMVGFAHFGEFNVAKAKTDVSELFGRIVAVIEEFIEEEVVKRVEELTKFGAVSGTTVSSNCFSIGGVERCYHREGFTATSSMVCRIKSPTNGTSTLVSFNANWTSGVLGANTFDVSTTTEPTGYGSSSPALVRAFSVASNANGRTLTWVHNSATTSITDLPVNSATANPQASPPNVLPSLRQDGSTNIILSTSTWVTLRYATSSPGVFATPATGACNAIFELL